MYRMRLERERGITAGIGTGSATRSGSLRSWELLERRSIRLNLNFFLNFLSPSPYSSSPEPSYRVYILFLPLNLLRMPAEACFRRAAQLLRLPRRQSQSGRLAPQMRSKYFIIRNASNGCLQEPYCEKKRKEMNLK